MRKAFTADVAAGKTLVVADYGQLELRILAHMANCKSMITAFEAGGDFHSRTALGMYDHIKEAIAAGGWVAPGRGRAWGLGWVLGRDGLCVPCVCMAWVGGWVGE